MFELHNVRMEPLNVRKKKPGIAGYLLVGTVPRPFFGGIVELLLVGRIKNYFV